MSLQTLSVDQEQKGASGRHTFKMRTTSHNINLSVMGLKFQEPCKSCIANSFTTYKHTTIQQIQYFRCNTYSIYTWCAWRHLLQVNDVPLAQHPNLPNLRNLPCLRSQQGRLSQRGRRTTCKTQTLRPLAPKHVAWICAISIDVCPSVTREYLFQGLPSSGVLLHRYRSVPKNRSGFFNSDRNKIWLDQRHHLSAVSCSSWNTNWAPQWKRNTVWAIHAKSSSRYSCWSHCKQKTSGKHQLNPCSNKWHKARMKMNETTKDD